MSVTEGIMMVERTAMGGRRRSLLEKKCQGAKCQSRKLSTAAARQRVTTPAAPDLALSICSFLASANGEHKFEPLSTQIGNCDAINQTGADRCNTFFFDYNIDLSDVFADSMFCPSG